MRNIGRFLPVSPAPMSGAVRIVAASRVRLLDTPMLGLLGCLTRSGVGGGDLASPVLVEMEGLVDGKATGERREGI